MQPTKGACAGDRDVSFGNSLRCQGQLAAHAADQRLSDVGDFDHSTTVHKALPQVGHEFDTVR
ncbi:hypothetical protein GT045_02920 [Streptomyces sp. SID486]|uniref:hypothetical protein n=1 Tax=Streptomyces sp. SID486 TaxID=2690264 RepID=UPI0013B9845E|nr:hypothetical protein [Streptomyces sp. SID486]MYX93788.1 hypothetical protein [Streptomyces sp. SID486]